MNLYVQQPTRTQLSYLDLWRGRPSRQERVEILRARGAPGSYEADYLSPVSWLCRLHPYQFITPGDVVVCCGALRDLIASGVSQPMFFSAVTGPKGRVVIVEADPANVVAMKAFIQDNSVENVEIVEAAVWSKEGEGTFRVMGTKAGSSMIKEFAKGDDIKVKTTTLDALDERFRFDFVNLTINGAEPEALQGATEVMRRGARFCVAMKSSSHEMFNHRMKALSMLANAGYHVGVAESYADGPWITEPFWFAVATKKAKELLDLGFRPSGQPPEKVMTIKR